jgi:hypothetical protein
MTVAQNKNSKISSWGLGSWDPATKEHMMAYDKQTIKRLYNDVRRGSKPLGGYEDLDPHGYISSINPNPLCVFGHQINKEQLKG